MVTEGKRVKVFGYSYPENRRSIPPEDGLNAWLDRHPEFELVDVKPIGNKSGYIECLVAIYRNSGLTENAPEPRRNSADRDPIAGVAFDDEP